jgi:hypothetical protein
MKKIRNIKVIKAGSTGRSVAVEIPENLPETVIEQRCPAKVVKDWVSEHRAQKQLAEAAARDLLDRLSPSAKRAAIIPTSKILKVDQFTDW